MASEYVRKTVKSKALYDRAKKVFPAGVSYGIRYFEPYPFFTKCARGSKLFDVDGNDYVDYWLGHTALILGHSPIDVVDAVRRQLEKGTHYGTSHALEVELAEKVAQMVPSANMIRFTNSGTEANMYATRLARACTSRKIIAKFEGGWHGGYDALHVGVKYPFDVPESAGLTTGATEDTVLLPYNDLGGVRNRLKGKLVASILIEPVLGAGGGIAAEKEFLKGLREFCDQKDILLIFDEVITGFRLAPGGAQEYLGVKPDITILGKILGGGFPVGAFCGNKRLMDRIDSLAYKRSDIAFHGGTFTGNPMTMTAGLATLKRLEDGTLNRRLNQLGDRMRHQLQSVFDERSVKAQVIGVGSLFNVHFTAKPPKNARDTCKADRKRLLEYNLALIRNGVFILPTHNAALCSEHSQADLERLISETENYTQTSQAHARH